jgi:hypothetical protein
MFHVPERDRLAGYDGGEPGIPAGEFLVESCEPGWRLVLICDDGRCPELATGWEHVSVRAFRGKQSRVPTWREMTQIKRLCWDATDVVMQLHPAESEYVNRHPHVLHLWRPIDTPIPVPPVALV